MSAEKQKRKIILVAEDEQVIATALYQVLEYAGYELLKATNGEEALRQIETQQPDVVILDIVMPKMDGWEVCKRLKTNPSTQSIPVLIYTTLCDRKDMEKGEKLGADKFVGKDKTPVEVLAALQSLIKP